MNLTLGELQQNIAAALAFSRGEPIEYWNGFVWVTINSISTLDIIPFRPRPEPKTRAWTAKDVPLNCWVRYCTVTDRSRELITGITANGVILMLGIPSAPQPCEVAWTTLQKCWLWSLDSIDWHKCEVTE